MHMTPAYTGLNQDLAHMEEDELLARLDWLTKDEIRTVDLIDPDFQSMSGSFKDWTLQDCMWYFQRMNWRFYVNGNTQRICAH